MTEAERTRGIRRVLLVILVLNWLVAAAKAVVAYFSNALSVQADAYHSFLDGSSNIVGLIAITLAAAAADREHPYGHRKFEVLGAMVIGVFLALAAYDIVRESILRLKSGVVPRPDIYTFSVMAVTIVINLFVTIYERRRGTELNSEVLIADSAHTRTDVGASIAVIAALVFDRFNMPIADVIVSLLIGALIAWAAWGIASRGATVLSDHFVLDPDVVAKAARQVEGVRDCHEVRTRGTADAVFADLRVHVDPKLTLSDAHALGHRVEQELKKAFPGLRDIVVHLEPDDETHC